MIKKLITWARPRLRWINIGLAAFALTANQYMVQGFCQPVAWAGIVLLLSIGAFLAWPWLDTAPRVVRYGLLFLQGVAFTVCAYCGWFMSMQPELYFIGFFCWWLLVPILVWVPAFFGLQLLQRVARLHLPGRWPVFLVGVLAPLIAVGWAQRQYQAVETAVARLPPAQRQQIPALLRVVPRSYMAERLAGAYFKYHNYPEFIFDGWRPPLHDPLVNVCLWLRGGWRKHANPLEMKTYQVYGGGYSGFYRSLNKQVKLYQQLFPQLPVKADCVCSRNHDGQSYQGWVPGTDTIYQQQ